MEGDGLRVTPTKPLLRRQKRTADRLMAATSHLLNANTARIRQPFGTQEEHHGWLR